MRSLKSLKEHHVVDGKRKERVGLAREVGDAILDGGIDNRVGVEFVRDGLIIPLKQVLIDSVVFIEQLER